MVNIMSKIGKQPISLPSGVNAKIEGNEIEVAGQKGNLRFTIRPEISVKVDSSEIKVERKSESKFARALHGLTRSIIANMVTGVTQGHEKTLEIVGVGYRANLQGEDLVLNVGYSHPVVIPKSEGIQIEAKDNKIFVSGSDKAKVGEIAAKIRRVRPPEPYKGKGIKYLGEIIRRKAGKSIKGATG